VLFDVSFSVGAGEVVTLLGRNGMGKTTTSQDPDGSVARAWRSARSRMRNCSPSRPTVIAQRGLGLVPEGRQVFPDLVGRGESRRDRGRTPRRGEMDARTRLPILAHAGERRSNMGNQLSGGEQQMLAIGRALMDQSEAVDPGRGDRRPGAADPGRDLGLSRQAQGRRAGDPAGRKHLDAMTKIADRHVVVEKGRVVWTGTSAALAADRSVKESICRCESLPARSGRVASRDARRRVGLDSYSAACFL